jgi:membrane-associated protein
MLLLCRFKNELGLWVFLGMVFAESGIFFGVVLPGDTLLFAAGLLAAKGFFHIGLLVASAICAAVLGDSVGYWTGKKAGPRIFTKEESFFFKKEYVTRAQAYFAKHGNKTIFFARFVPIVRTFAPILAGVAGMEYRRFIAYNIAGGITWCSSLLLLGYFLGTKVANIDAYILPIVGLIFVLSFIPVIKEYLRGRAARTPADLSN